MVCYIVYSAIWGEISFGIGLHRCTGHNIDKGGSFDIPRPIVSVFAGKRFVCYNQHGWLIKQFILSITYGYPKHGHECFQLRLKRFEKKTDISGFLNVPNDTCRTRYLKLLSLCICRCIISILVHLLTVAEPFSANTRLFRFTLRFSDHQAKVLFP